MPEVLKYLLLFFVGVAVVYVVVRVGSYAYFRTKLTYMRSIERETGDRRNGEG